MYVHESSCDWNEELQRRMMFVTDDASVAYTDFVAKGECIKRPVGGIPGKHGSLPLYGTAAALVALALASTLVVVSMP